MVKAYAMEPFSARRFEAINQELYHRELGLVRANSAMPAITGMLPALAMGLILLVGGRDIGAGRMAVSDFFTFAMYVYELTFPSPYLNHFQTRLIAWRSEGMHLSTTEHRNGFEEAFVRELVGFWAAIVDGAPIRNTAEHARADIDLVQRIARLALAG